MKNNTLAIALASLLVGGVAVAAFQNNTRDDTIPGARDADGATDGATKADPVPAAGRLEYVDVVDVHGITEPRDLYAQVLGSEPVRETTTSTTPRQVCQDVAVQYQAPSRDPNRIAGTTIGAVVGGALGNQVGGGDGRKLATVGGADRKSTRLNSSHVRISYAVFCLKKKKKKGICTMKTGRGMA